MYTPFILFNVTTKEIFHLIGTRNQSLGLPGNPLLNTLWMPYEQWEAMSLSQKKRRFRK